MHKIRCRFVQIILGAALVAGLATGRGWAADAPADSDPGNQGLPAPTNDLCINAIEIGNGSFDGWTINASNDGGAPCGPAGLNDVWYHYTAPQTGSVIFSTCNSGPDTVLSMSSGCPGTPFNLLLDCSTSSVCGNKGRIVRDVTQGQSFYIRVATTNAGFNLFTLDISMNNGTCSGATPITIPGVSGTTRGMSADGATSCGSSNTSPVVYYSFTAPSTRRIEINTCSTNVANDWDTVLSVHSGCPATAANTIACNDDSCDRYSRIILDVTQGTTYYIRVSGFNGASGDFNLEINNVTTPSNDACSGSVPELTNYGTYSSGQTLGATNDGSATCGNSATSPDVWYRFTAPENRNVKFTLCGSYNDWNSVLSIHNGCPRGGGSSIIACNDDLNCGKLSEISINTIQGTTYYLRVAGNNGAVGEFLLSVFPNDNCTGATPITSYGSYYGTTVGATNDGVASCPVDDATRDVWFAFTAQETRQVILSTCANGGQIISVHSACPGTLANEIACDPLDGCGNGYSKLILSAVQGTTYYIQLSDRYSWKPDAETFRLDVEPVPTNDSCASAQPIGYGSFEGNSLAATKEGSLACFDNDNRGGDVWFRFTAPETRTVKIEQVTTGFYGLLSVHSGCPGTTANDIACQADSDPELTLSVQQGQQYLILASGQYGQGGPFTLNVSPIELANDACANAEVIGYAGISGTNGGATPDGTSCFGGNPDVWYKYTASSSGTTTVDTCGSAFETIVSIHTACPGTAANQIACNGGSVCGVSSETQFQAVAGTTYYIRVAGIGGATGNFSLKISPPPPSNDTCASAIEVGYGIHNGTVIGATTDGETECALTTDDVWFRFTAPESGLVIFGTGAAFFDSVISIHTDCPGTTANTLACNNRLDYGSQVGLEVDQGQTYLVRVAVGPDGGEGDFTLSIAKGVETDCSTATPVTAGSYPGTTTAALPSDATACFDGPSPDLWYRYIAPGPGTVTFDTCTGTNFDSVLSAYSDCPGTSATLLVCNDDACAAVSSKIQVPVTQGTEYYIRVAGLAGASGSFTLTVTEDVYNGRPYGDLNSDGCVNLSDFLLLLDYWQVVYAGQEVGLNDFLALLDYWETCPGPG